MRPGKVTPKKNMKMYSSSNDVAIRNPMQHNSSSPKVPMKIHFLPITSDRNPIGSTVDATRTPMKKHAPRNPILFLLSHNMFACSYQF